MTHDQLAAVEVGTVLHFTNWPGRPSVPVTWAGHHSAVIMPDGSHLSAFPDELSFAPRAGLEVGEADADASPANGSGSDRSDGLSLDLERARRRRGEELAAYWADIQVGLEVAASGAGAPMTELVLQLTAILAEDDRRADGLKVAIAIACRDLLESDGLSLDLERARRRLGEELAAYLRRANQWPPR